MKISPYQVRKNPDFVGRSSEISKLKKVVAAKQAQIVVVHGRRRAGKTELLEQFFRGRNVLKFEGLERGTPQKQREAFAGQLIDYLGFSQEILEATSSWTKLLKLLHHATSTGAWTIYLEEVQWLASYKDDLISELKYVWDNFFRHNPQLILIFCGSSPSFMKNKVVRSKSLYSRSMHEIALKPFSLAETKLFLGTGRSNQSILDCYLSIGGIPEYLNYFKKEKSVFASLCKESFVPGGYFVGEADRIFVSSLGDKDIYRKIVFFLAVQRYASRQEIANTLGVSSGGNLTEALSELEQAGLIESYQPYNTKFKSKLVRYCIADEYLQFYAKFLLPELKNIHQGAYEDNPVAALPVQTYRQWLGYSLERFCRRNHYKIAKLLEFSGVKYNAGSYFRRSNLNHDTGYQIDLVFDRRDQVLTVCEIKYLADKVTTSTIDELSQKLSKLVVGNKDVQKVLIAPNGVTSNVLERLYFDRILEIDELMHF